MKLVKEYRLPEPISEHVMSSFATGLRARISYLKDRKPIEVATKLVLFDVNHLKPAVDALSSNSETGPALLVEALLVLLISPDLAEILEVDRIIHELQA